MPANRPRERELGQDLRPHQHVGCCCGIAAFGARSGCGIRTQLDLASQQRVHTLWVHDQQDEIGLLAAELEGGYCIVGGVPADRLW